MSETRKLAAILVADVVGYSRLAGADEERTLARLRGLRSDLIDPTIAVHHGRVVKRTGDGAIIEFRSVVDAVRCAIEVQTGLTERNTGLPPEKRIEFRVGIHLGDVVEESDGDLMGDGVNIAARLQAVSKPGGICLSEDAYRQVRGRLALSASDRGSMPLKNIAEPMRVYSLEMGGPDRKKKGALGRSGAKSPVWILVALTALVTAIVAGASLLIAPHRATPIATSAPASPEAPHLSLMVLPFKNLSSDPGLDRFADSITDSVTTDLSRMRKSFVIARDTAFTFKGKSVDASEVGKRFGVRYLLEGSLQREQDRTRVNAQLIDAQSGAHLWADRFEEHAPDTFELQDRILSRLGPALRAQLIIAEAEKGARSKSPDAIDLTMRGRALMQEQRLPQKERNDAATALFEQALKLDPAEPDALAGLALAYARRNAWWVNFNPEYTRKVFDLANQAIERDPSNVTAYIAMSYAMDADDRWNEMIRSANAGLAIDPHSAALYAARGMGETMVNRYDEGIADIQKARQMDRYDPDVLYFAR
jgi:adenylate cyclase